MYPDDGLYSSVSRHFADTINAAFESEETLQALFKEHWNALPFDRTNHWRGILQRELQKCWDEYGPAVKSPMLPYDTRTILLTLTLLLDFNLFTQVLTNLQSYGSFTYQLDPDWNKVMKERYVNAAVSPFTPKAKMYKNATLLSEHQFNADLSTIKAANIIEQLTAMLSFRVTPKGSTPAFADSKNLSMLGVGGDRFLRLAPGLQLCWVTWEPGSTPLITEPNSDGSLMVKGIPYPFVSKSGGEILNEALFARLVTRSMFCLETDCVLPRMNSVMIITRDIAGTHLAFDTIKRDYKMLQFVEGTRI